MRAFLKNTTATAIFAATAAVALVSPAQAATVLFNFATNPSGTGWGSISGTDANARIFSAVSGVTTVKVRATGWSVDSAGVIRDSFLGGFSPNGSGVGGGLGVTSGDDSGGASGKHAVDNQTRTDFVLLQFDRSVELDQAKFNAISISGLGYTDTDATIGGGNTTLNWQTQPNLDGQNISSLNAIIPTANRFASAGGSAGGTRAINPSNYTGNVWLISAALATHNSDTKIDSFKLDAVQASFLAALPEPGTWATMIIGFGMIGGVVRRRRRTLAAAL